MKSAWISSLCALALTACSGSDPATTTTTSSLAGVVYQLDGQTVDRSGVTVRVVETGDTVVTDAQGAFGFTGLEPGSYTLDFTSPFTASRLAAEEGTGGAEEPGAGGVGENEDGEGRPRVTVTRSCGRIDIRIALENGEVREFSIETHDVRAAKAPLRVPEGVSFDVEGQVRLAESGERSVLEFDVAPLDAGTTIEFFLDAREGAGPVSIGTALANGDGVATLLLDTGAGDALPLEAASLDDLAGDRVEVRFSGTDTTILVGEIPDLPDPSEHRCEEDSGTGGDGGGGVEEPPAGDGTGDLHARALLESDLERFEGHVEIRSWERENIQRFRMDLWGLEPGDRVAFEIYAPAEEAWVVLGYREANADRYAKVDTDGDLDMPLGVESVKQLVGHSVRVRRASETDSDTVLAIGIVPELVGD